MSFLSIVVSKIADSIVDNVLERLDKRLDKYFDIKARLDERDKRALEIKDMIKKAQTDEERDVLLDQMDSLLKDTIKPS